MAHDQLEIIAADGNIEFYNLDPARGLTNIGRHPENDIVIDDPGVAPFLAMLDHRQKPYQFVLLSQEGQTTLRGETLYPNGGVPLNNLDTIQVGSHTLILMESQSGQQAVTPPGPTPTAPAPSPPRQPTAPTTPYQPPTTPPPPSPPPPSSPPPPAVPARPASMPPPTSRPEPVSSGYAAPPSSAPVSPAAYPPPSPTPTNGANGHGGHVVGYFQALPPEQRDDYILTELSHHEATTAVDQSVTFELTIANGGPLVAAFTVEVQGLDDSWVSISQPYLNLNEGERAGVTIAITPPRLPSSRAGDHYVAIVVTSADYYGRYSQHGATLTIEPYYEFTLGQLTPKQQTISWFRRSGRASLSIINKGNGQAPFRIDGSDEERACSFEFEVPGEQVAQAAQAELRLQPEQAATVPIQVTPHSRRLFGFRKRNYSFTVNTTPLAAEQTPRSQLGQLGHKPLFGLWQILLMALLLVAVIVYIFRPTITLFSVEPRLVRAGDEVTLRWNTSPFANLRINNGIGAVDAPRGEMIVVPEDSATYELRSENWVSWISRGFFSYLREARVEVEPIIPAIRVFQVDQESIFTGEEATLTWEVTSAEEVILATNGVPETLTEAEHTGQRVVTPQEDSTYALTARNRFGEVIENVEVRVGVPPVPTPFVRRFTVDKQVIAAGESIVLDWEVEGADIVELIPIGEVPPIQSLSRAPPQSLEYVLTARKGEARSQPIIRQVVVNTPTPGPTATPEPEAPVIEFFTASPDEVITGEEEDISLAWSVIGETTNIEISGPDIGIVSGLNAQGSLAVSADEATLFILTASNDSLNASQTIQVSDEDPTPTPTEPPPTEPPPTPTATPLPPNIIFFQAAAADPNDDNKVTFISDSPLTYEVIVGTKINLSWQIQNATQASLSLNSASLGDQPFDGVLPQTVTSDGNYLLTASNDQEGVPPDTTQLQIVAIQQIPPPPFGLIGTEGMTNTIELEWQYNNEDENDIIGFRLYRDDDRPFDTYKRVADEKDLDAGTRDWDDTKDLNETCDKAYYVVAVYEDFTGQLFETDASANSWSSLPCP